MQNKPLISGKWFSFGLIYFFFFYFSGITHVLLQINDATIFNSLRQAFYMSFLWLIPVLVFPDKTKLISGVIGVVLWSTSLISLGYYFIYQQEFSYSVLFIVLDSNIKESSEFISQYFEWWMIPAYLLHSLVAFLLWRKIKPVYFENHKVAMISSIILIITFIFPVTKDVLAEDMPPIEALKKMEKRMSPAEPWSLVMGYMQYQDQLQKMQALLQKNASLPPLENMTDKYAGLPTTMVLVIGESTNRQHMSLYDYHRQTTPRLDGMRSELAVFNNVISSKPSTIESLIDALTFADAADPNAYLNQPSLMNLMKQAGYETYWITNQQTISKRNTMLTNFSKQMDHQVYLNNSRNQNSRIYDELVLPPFNEILNDSAKRKFIVVHLLGTHMKYKYRYPEGFDKFHGSKDINYVTDEEKITTINQYDNAVLYNDYIVSSLIQSLKDSEKVKNTPSFLVYFSDHGEDVYDTPPHDFQGRNISAPTLAMYAVPMLIWRSGIWPEPMDLSQNADKAYCLADFIHTWSDLAGLHYDGFEPEKSLITKSTVNEANEASSCKAIFDAL